MDKFEGTINARLLKFAKQRELVIMVGAGVSADSPSSLPGWYGLNAIIARVLCQRLDQYLDKDDWLSQFIPDTENNPKAFPPNYQAQIIEEICGENYFRAFQCLDVDAINPTHEAIARLAATGAVRCIVTTNFDCLVECALDKHRIRYIVAYDEGGYARMAERLVADEQERTVFVLKIHGSVTDHLSMIDTLKKRNQVRSTQLQTCLDRLHPFYWLFLGFSAEDLETDPGFPGLLNGATYGSGATYIAHPSHPVLTRGAKLLMEAYEERGEIISAFNDEYLNKITGAPIFSSALPAIRNNNKGLKQFEKNLERWVNSLSPVTAALYITAILEATGEAERAAHFLDHLVREELYDYRDTPEFYLLRLHYGRLGASWRRFFGVPDANGMSTNAGIETVQSLLQLSNTAFEFSANSWLCVLYLWLNKGEMATRASVKILRNIHENDWSASRPSSPEELADGWISAAQVSVLNAGPEIIRLTIDTAETACQAVIENGNLIKAARIIALKGLCLAQTSVDLDRYFAQHESIFRHAERACDSYSLGFRCLALGRWSAGSGSVEKARISAGDIMARVANAHLEEAVKYLAQSGLQAWVIYAKIQQAKAFSDLKLFEEAQVCIDYATETAERFPIMSTFIEEVIGQILQMQGNPDALDCFQNALDDARDSGLNFRSLFLESIIASQREKR